MSNVCLKLSRCANEGEILINRCTKLVNQQQTEVSFNIKEKENVITESYRVSLGLQWPRYFQEVQQL